jgi:hypothetical protein
MKTVKVKCFNVFTFDELSREAQDKAVVDEVNFLCEFFGSYYPLGFVERAAKRLGKMRTPWFLAETLYHDYRKEVESEIITNELLFFSDGVLFHRDEHLLYSGD